MEVVTSPPVKSTCGSAAKFEPTRTLPMKVELGAMSWSSNAVASSVRSSCCLCSVSLSWQMAMVVLAGYVLDHFHVFEGSYENCATCLLHIIYADDVDAWRP